MSEQVVKRYDISGFGGGMVESADGAWYHMDDYDALHAEVEALRAENGRLKEQYDRLFKLSVLLRIDSTDARILLRDIAPFFAAPHGRDDLHHRLDSFLSTPAPEVQAEQGERQESQQKPVGHVFTMQPCFPGEPKRAHAQLHVALPGGTKLYAQPQPGPDVRGLAASLYQACGAYDMPERILDALSAAANGEPFAHMIDGLLPCVPPSEQDVRGLVEALGEAASELEDWRMSFPDANATVTDGLLVRIDGLIATHRQAQSKESEQ